MPPFSSTPLTVAQKVRVLLEKFVANPSFEHKKAYVEELKAYLGRRIFLSLSPLGDLIVAAPAPERIPTVVCHIASVILEYDEEGRLKVLKSRDAFETPHFERRRLQDLFPGALPTPLELPTLWQRLMADE